MHCFAVRRRAEELERLGPRQKATALQTLHDVICSKRNRTWSKTHELIMFKHIDLCVEMKKRNYAKEALMQYRNMCHQINVASLEEVIRYFLKKASEKAEEAQAAAAAVSLARAVSLALWSGPAQLPWIISTRALGTRASRFSGQAVLWPELTAVRVHENGGLIRAWCLGCVL